MKFKKVLTFLVSATLVTAAMTGCSGSGSKETTTTQQEVSEEVKKDEEKNDKQYLNLSMLADPKVLDPPFASDGESGLIIDNVFDALMKYEPDGTVVPNLAESVSVEAEGKQYIFKIKSNIKFHDGTTCDAEAIKWNFERQLGDKASPDMPYANSIFGKIESVEAPDAQTFIVNLKQADSTFLPYMAQKVGGGIVSPTAWEKDPEGFKRNPVGTGPYKFVEWVSDQYVKLEAFEEYHEGTPANGGLNCKIIKESAVRTSEFLTGGIDYLFPLDYNDIDRIKAEGYEVHSKSSAAINYMAFVDYENNEIFKDAKLREAVWCAIDRDALVQGLYQGHAAPSKSIMPPIMLAGDKEYTNPTYNPERAKELMKEAGYESGFKFKALAYNVTKGYNPAAEKLAVAIQNELAKVGITMEIEIQQWSEFLTSAYSEKPNYDVIFLGWGAATNDPSYMTQLLEGVNSGTGNNHAGYNNETFNQLINEVKITPDSGKQEELYAKALQIANDDMPWFHISNPTEYWVYQKNVKGDGLLGLWGTQYHKVVKE